MSSFNIDDIIWKNLNIPENSVINTLTDLFKVFNTVYVFDNEHTTKHIYFYSNYEKLQGFLDILVEISKEPSKRWSEMKTVQKSVINKVNNIVYLNSSKSLIPISPPYYPKFQYFSEFEQQLSKFDIVMTFSYLQFLIEKLQVIIWYKNPSLTCVSDKEYDYSIACQHIRTYCFYLNHEYSYNDQLISSFSSFDTIIKVESVNVNVNEYKNRGLTSKNVQRFASDIRESKLLKIVSQEGKERFKETVNYMRSIFNYLLFWKGDINLTLSIGYLYFENLSFRSNINAGELDSKLKISKYNTNFSKYLICSKYNIDEICDSIRSKIKFSDTNFNEYILLCCCFHHDNGMLVFDVKFNIENNVMSVTPTIENSKSVIFSRSCPNICQPADIQVKILTRANNIPLEYDEFIQQFIKTIKPVNNSKLIWITHSFIDVWELKKVKSIFINTDIAKIELNQIAISQQSSGHLPSGNVPLIFQSIQIQREIEYLSIDLHATYIDHFFALPIKIRRQNLSYIPNKINVKYFHQLMNLAANIIDCI
ncbi:hypothetical protein CONCODRAFT_2727 [Conidiobolus coronatus NRRL 28638]|uniref:Uncharacterized protein n=1 Tax=Conidiobolus coronatus (strain ATCC 28846 / CBS 209.66 / NRRL 28638) TaxID=796925 RepID=A0A137PGR2_CONC2|nr:hypothetical protein CONCODRAFT_2727 [Conidiobolus coronatus NRRL 28638]|eukprot:KXN74196.1 hypothetical protein CONCODRAFT_2727 [Conidiobolus coronatus NRRL 28638]